MFICLSFPGDDLYDALGVKDKQLSQAAPISISNS